MALEARPVTVAISLWLRTEVRVQRRHRVYINIGAFGQWERIGLAALPLLL
jgi:hypothetical protein